MGEIACDKRMGLVFFRQVGKLSVPNATRSPDRLLGLPDSRHERGTTLQTRDRSGPGADRNGPFQDVPLRGRLVRLQSSRRQCRCQRLHRPFRPRPRPAPNLMFGQRSTVDVGIEPYRTPESDRRNIRQDHTGPTRFRCLKNVAPIGSLAVKLCWSEGGDAQGGKLSLRFEPLRRLCKCLFWAAGGDFMPCCYVVRRAADSQHELCAASFDCAQQRSVHRSSSVLPPDLFGRRRERAVGTAQRCRQIVPCVTAIPEQHGSSGPQ